MDNKQVKVNKVCTKYGYGQECNYGKKTVNLYIKEYAKYGQCRCEQRCQFSHDLEGRCKEKNMDGVSLEKKFFLLTP